MYIDKKRKKHEPHQNLVDFWCSKMVRRPWFHHYYTSHITRSNNNWYLVRASWNVIIDKKKYYLIAMHASTIQMWSSCTPTVKNIKKT